MVVVLVVCCCYMMSLSKLMLTLLRSISFVASPMTPSGIENIGGGQTAEAESFFW